MLVNGTAEGSEGDGVETRSNADSVSIECAVASSTAEYWEWKDKRGKYTAALEPNCAH